MKLGNLPSILGRNVIKPIYTQENSALVVDYCASTTTAPQACLASMTATSMTAITSPRVKGKCNTPSSFRSKAVTSLGGRSNVCHGLPSPLSSSRRCDVIKLGRGGGGVYHAYISGEYYGGLVMAGGFPRFFRRTHTHARTHVLHTPARTHIHAHYSPCN